MIIYRPILRGAGASTGVTSTAELVALRPSMLDELERRDPAGFGRLDSGADARGDLGPLAAEPCA
jgi:hypothetical protein